MLQTSSGDRSPPSCVSFFDNPLEVQLQGKLGGTVQQRRRGHLPHGAGQDPKWCRELGVVEDIEEIGAELKVNPFGQRRVLVKGHIPVIDSRWVVVEHPIAIGAHSRPDLIPLVFYESLGRGLIEGLSKNIVGSIAIGEKEYGFAVRSPVGGLVVTVVEREPARRGQRVAVLPPVGEPPAGLTPSRNGKTPVVCPPFWSL